MSDHAFRSSPTEIRCAVPNEFGRPCGMFPGEHSEPAGPNVTTHDDGSQNWTAVGGETVVVWQEAGLGLPIDWRWAASLEPGNFVGRGSNFRHRSQARHTAMAMFPPFDGGRTENVVTDVMTEIAIAEPEDEDVPKLILQGLHERGWLVTPMPRLTRYYKIDEEKLRRGL